MNDLLGQLCSALERTRYNFKLAVAGKPVRDMAETLAEVDAALNAAVQAITLLQGPTA